MDPIHDRSTFLPNLFYSDSHLLIPKSKGWLCHESQQRNNNKKIYTCFLTECLVSPAYFPQMILYTSPVSDVYHVTDAICFSVNASLTHIHTRSLPPLLYLRGGECLGFPSVPVFLIRPPYASPGLNTSWYSCSRDSYTELQDAFFPKFFCSVSEFIYRETVISAYTVLIKSKKQFKKTQLGEHFCLVD